MQNVAEDEVPWKTKFIHDDKYATLVVVGEGSAKQLPYSAETMDMGDIRV